MSNKLSDITLKELVHFDHVHWDGEIVDMDDFLNEIWSSDIEGFTYGIEKDFSGQVIMWVS